ncbi:DUF4365 domain-containing protein [Acinetobacter zhairhuonensis]|uniref:DUF4365 domain-containing protein n=1 Tax=Acinetobacter sp. A7.4 TaxID=2919921 RepID=UPI001F501805|nr:DUF4365 domain-containing protein [Acinetobacter sp. A7.4]MCJ8162087.1 DUF4365 domain-containing protein [Acinetobacter sp. A7.4]
MNAKEIGRRAGRVFEFCLPDNWIFRSQEDQEDYGIDGEVEINTSQDKATGFIFKAQIKGQKEVNIIDGGKRISFSISLERLQYYMSNIEIAVILFVVDVTNGLVYWHSLQDDEKLRISMKEALTKKQDTITVHLKTTHVLKRDNINELLEAININLDWLRLNGLKKINYSEIFKKSTDEKVQDWLEQSKDQSYYAYMEQFERLYLKKEHEKLLQLIHLVFPSKTEKIELRFYAGLYAEKVCEQDLGLGSEEYYRASFEIFKQLLGLVRTSKFSKYYQIYILLLCRSWILRQQINIDYHHFMSVKMVGNDPLMGLIAQSVQRQSSLNVSINLLKTIRLVNHSIDQKDPNIFLDTFPKLATSIILLVHKLRDEGQKEALEALDEWLSYCTDLGLKLALNSEQEELFILFLNVSVSLKVHSKDQVNYIAVARQMIEWFQKKDLQEFFLDYLDKLEEKYINDNQEYNLSPDEELDFYKKHAKKLGFDFDDPNDEFGRIIKQGLDDYNPERVLKDCENLLVFNSSALGVPAKMVGLPSATMKIIHCLEYKYTGGGWGLDIAYQGFGDIPDSGFKNRHCLDCEKCKPRKDDWKWNSRWQAEMYKENMELFRKLDSW